MYYVVSIRKSQTGMAFGCKTCSMSAGQGRPCRIQCLQAKADIVELSVCRPSQTLQNAVSVAGLGSIQKELELNN